MVRRAALRRVMLLASRAQRGTPVTLENFVEWNKMFKEQQRKSGKYVITELPRQHPGPTGKVQFEGGMVAEPEPDEAEVAEMAASAAVRLSAC